jgi:NADH-quinone oxidoreductase subunit J
MIELDVLYVLISVFAVISALLVFVFKKLLHAALALTVTFLASALLFAAIGQTFIGLLQILIFVGGLSAYLIAAVATENKGKEMLKHAPFFASAIVLSIAFTVIAVLVPQGTYATSTLQQSSSIMFSQYYLILFILTLLLFSTAIGGVIIIKKFRRLVV